ncbi:MAG TPA: hypothetical protein DF613_09080 [Lachnospiraceae bacterium]|nr:hypothetical protein [Lachnospiraceae bacterium]
MLKYGYQIGEASKITGISKDTLHFVGLKAVWWTFPLTELIAAAICIIFERSKVCQIDVK